MPAVRRYDSFSIALHWLVAFAVLSVYGMGIVREAIPKGDARTLMLSLHMSLGVVVLALSVLRLGWSILRSAPEPVEGPRWAMASAKWMQIVLYAGLVTVPLLGLVSYWARGRGVAVFWLFELPSPIAANRSLVEALEEVHGFVAHLTVALAGLHAAAALLHHFLYRDQTLLRMMPNTAVGRLSRNR